MIRKSTGCVVVLAFVCALGQACSSNSTGPGEQGAAGESPGTDPLAGASTGGTLGDPATGSGGSAAGDEQAGGSGSSGAATDTGGTTGDGSGGTGLIGASGAPSVIVIGGGGFLGVSDDGTQALCGGAVCTCNNGLDDDGDGLEDGFDPECISAFDDDEGTFATGIPGDNSDPVWQDCFFDGDSGAGNDRCRYRTGCLTGELEPTDEDCTVSDQCVQNCQPLTPNGCDCFGCCTIDVDGAEVNVILGSECSVADVDDEVKCPRCVPTTSCNNDCGECELCLGKTPADLPASCSDTPPDGSGGSTGTGGSGGDVPPPPNACPEGVQACDENNPCLVGNFCFQGCCQALIR